MGVLPYELHLVRRDGRRIDKRHQPRPVREEFDIKRDLDKIVGKHFLPLAALAEDEYHRVKHFSRARDFDKVLRPYEVEVWREPSTRWHEPAAVSRSTEGWD